MAEEESCLLWNPGPSSSLETKLRPASGSLEADRGRCATGFQRPQVRVGAGGTQQIPHRARRSAPTSPAAALSTKRILPAFLFPGTNEIILEAGGGGETMEREKIHNLSKRENNYINH